MNRTRVAPEQVHKGPRRVLRLRSGIAKEAADRPRRFIRSWAGHLDLRDRLRALAERVLVADAAAARAAEARGWSATGAICAAIRDPSMVTCPEVAEAARLFAELRNLQSELIWSHNLDGNLVVNEATLVLDPANAERHQQRTSQLLQGDNEENPTPSGTQSFLSPAPACVAAISMCGMEAAQRTQTVRTGAWINDEACPPPRSDWRE